MQNVLPRSGVRAYTQFLMTHLHISAITELVNTWRVSVQWAAAVERDEIPYLCVKVHIATLRPLLNIMDSA